jgi:hypothetical protein
VTGPGREHQPIHAWAGAFALLAVFGAIIWAVTQRDFAICQAPLAAAVSGGCGLADAAHLAGQLLTALFGVLFVVAVVV